MNERLLKRRHGESSSSQQENPRSAGSSWGAEAGPQTSRTTNQRAVTARLSEVQKLPAVSSEPASKYTEGMSPACFLREILRSSDNEMSVYDGTQFHKPSEEEMASYDTELVNALRSRDIGKLRQFHQAGRSLNACNRFGESLLHMACRRGYVDVVKFLLEEARVKVNVRDDFGRTVLHDACWTVHAETELMGMLLRVKEGRQLLLSPDVRGHTPFDYARREHWDTWVSFLDQRRSLLQAQDEAMQVIA